MFFKSFLFFNYFIIDFNTIINKPINEALIRFVKINDIHNYKIYNKTKYLIIKFDNKDNSKLSITNNNLFIDIKDDDDNIINKLNNNPISIPLNPIKLNNYNFSIYNYIKNNNKPLLLISNEKDKKYSYFIKDYNNYICKYNFNYNNIYYRYIFEITSNKINDNETFWYIVAKINLISSFKLIIFQLINWINFIINTNIKNYYFKKYIIMSYFLNIQK